MSEIHSENGILCLDSKILCIFGGILPRKWGFYFNKCKQAKKGCPEYNQKFISMRSVSVATFGWKASAAGPSNKGFTLIELMVAMLISVLVAVAVFYAYEGQQHAQLGQKQIVEMQQNIRAATYIMVKEIRKAGYDPSGGAGAGISLAGDGSNGNPLGFSFVADNDGLDNNGDGTIDETGELQIIEYDLYDADGDGDMDIGRKEGAAGSRQAIAENMAVLSFVYLDSNGSTTMTLQDIRAVQITMGAAIGNGKIDYINGVTRTLTTTVQCRNLFF